MIKIVFIHEGKRHEINATGLGDLGWQLDAWGCDSAGSDDDFTVVSIELFQSTLKEGVKISDIEEPHPPVNHVKPTSPIYLCLQCGVPLDGRPHYSFCETNNPDFPTGTVAIKK